MLSKLIIIKILFPISNLLTGENAAVCYTFRSNSLGKNKNLYLW